MRLPKWALSLGFGALLIGAAGAGRAQDKDDKSGKADKASPSAAQIPGTCRMYVVWDKRFDAKDDQNRVGKLHDPVGEFGLAPVLGVFSRTIPTKPDAPIMTLMQEQDRLALKFKALRFGAFAAFLSLTKDFPDDGDRDTRISELSNAAKQANLSNVSIGVAEATVEENGKTVPSPQATDWKIGDEDDITVVFYHRFEVLGRWSFTKDKPPTAVDIDNIAAEVEKVLGPKGALPKKK